MVLERTGGRFISANSMIFFTANSGKAGLYTPIKKTSLMMLKKAYVPCSKPYK